MTKELKEMIAPRWCEEQNGVFVPLIGKVLEAKSLTSELMSWQKMKAFPRRISRIGFSGKIPMKIKFIRAV